jgi:hypothetical protein
MATDPIFSGTVVLGAALLGNAETNLNVPTTASVILTAGASGSRVDEIVIEAAGTSITPTTVAGLVYIFIYDGSAYHLYDTIVVSAVVASTTAPPFRYATRYNNLILPSGYSLRASQSIAGNASILRCIAFGGDF